MMDSSSGISTNSSGLQNSGSEEDLKLLMDQRKRKRMISNRESARRSRARKQKHLDELVAQVAQLRKENHQMLTGLNVTVQHYINVESENEILRAQVAELCHRLQSCNEIASLLSSGDGGSSRAEEATAAAYGMDELAGFGFNSWNCFSQPIVMSASAASVDAGLLY